MTEATADSADTDRTYLFPLNTVLFPGGVLPLKIFEQRYLEMTKSASATIVLSAYV